MPGSRIALLGKNGSGKSTLIRTLLGQEEPTTGEVKRSDQLKIAYFEQNRDSLDPTRSLAETLCPRGDYVEFRGERVHIRSYLDRFLFTPQQMDLAVGKLSGGEQSRILIAELMLKTANVLVLDEPTNDLDMATLSVLEDCLTQFDGAVLLVTHDRYFLDQVANQIIAFPEDGSSELIKFADLEQWEDWYYQSAQNVKEASRATSAKSKSDSQKRKLSYNEQREFDSMESNIHKAEAELESLMNESALPEIGTNAKKLTEITNKMSKLQTSINQMYARWQELEKFR